MSTGGGAGSRDYMGKKWSTIVIVIYKWKSKWSSDAPEWLPQNCWSFPRRWWLLHLSREKYTRRCADDNQRYCVKYDFAILSYSLLEIRNKKTEKLIKIIFKKLICCIGTSYFVCLDLAVMMKCTHIYLC